MVGSTGATTRAEDTSLDTRLEERVRIVILVRWTLIATAVLSAATGVPTHALLEPTQKLASPTLPLTTLATWIVFNTFFHLYYRRLFRLKAFRYGQILCDLLIPIPFLHFSAGIWPASASGSDNFITSPAGTV